MTQIHDVAVIGGGTAGHSAAIYTARADLRPVIFEGSVTAGGALYTTTDVENYPGFPEGIQGPDLIDNMRKQAQKFGARYITDDITAVDLTGEVKTLTDGDGTVHYARTVIIATGSGYRRLGLLDEDRLAGHGVSWCATCDGAFFKGRHLAVVGGGDTALEEALFLTRFAERVTLVHRREQLRASKIMQSRALAHEKIGFAWNSRVEAIHGEKTVTGLLLRDTVTDEACTLPVTGVFIAIGHDPRSELFTGQLDLDDAGYIRVQSPSTRTKISGVFACGDVVDHTYRQAVTAAGTGCAAALDAERWLASKEH